MNIIENNFTFYLNIFVNRGLELDLLFHKYALKNALNTLIVK